MISYSERSHLSHSALGKDLLHLMDEKQTNLALSADVIHAADLLMLADLLGPHICILKTHIDIINDFTPNLTFKLQELAKKHQFLIFEDRKFADIGQTVKHQYQGGIYQIADWAHLVNAHTLPGRGIIQSLANVGKEKNRGLILLAEMSSEGNLMDENYRQKTLDLAEQFSDFVIGFITQHALSHDLKWVNLTPGIQLQEGKDQLGQQYITPEKAILAQGSDVIIVGRGIIAAENPLLKAEQYRKIGWECYLERCSKKASSV